MVIDWNISSTFGEHGNKMIMKKQILKKLAKIQKVAELTGMEGQVSLEFAGCTITEWDNAIESITEYERFNHFIQVAPKLTVALLLG